MVAEVSNMCHANSLRNMMRGQIVPRQTSRWSQSPGGAIFLLSGVSGESGGSKPPTSCHGHICYMAHVWPIYGIYYDQNHLEAASNFTDFPRLIMPLWRNVSTTSNSWPGNQISLDWDGNIVTFSWVLVHPFPCNNIFGSSQTLPKYTWQLYNISYISVIVWTFRSYHFLLKVGDSVDKHAEAASVAVQNSKLLSLSFKWVLVIRSL